MDRRADAGTDAGMDMGIHVIGAGAIGKLLAARLALSGESRHLVLVTRRPAQADLINAGGISLTEPDGTRTMRIRAVSWDEYAAGGGGPPADAVMLAVKQRHLDGGLLVAAARRLKPDGIAVAWMNGIGHERAMAAAFGASRAALAVTTEGARNIGDAAVEHAGRGETKLGFPAGGGERAMRRLKNVGCRLRKAGFHVDLSNDIRQEAWNKLVINAVINPLTAIYGIENGDLLASPFLRNAMRILYLEAVAVAAKEGAVPDDALWDRLVDVCRRTARNRSSMLQDLAAGRRTEIDWINGSLIRAAVRHGVPVPGHRAVYDAVRGMENARA